MMLSFKLGVSALLIAGLFIVPSAFQDEKKPAYRKVQDGAMLFSEKAVEQANDVIAAIKEKTRKELVIETLEKGPTKDTAKWAEKRFDNLKIDGVYIVITNEPKRFEIVVGKKTRENGYFTTVNRDELKKILATKLKEDRNEAIVLAARHVLITMSERTLALAPRVIKDSAKLFGENAVKDANALVTKIKEAHQKDLFIETLEEGKDAKEYAAWAEARSKEAGVDGVYIVITNMPKRFQVVVTEKARDKYFTIADRNETAKLLQGLARDRDETLLKVAQHVSDAMDRRNKKASGNE